MFLKIKNLLFAALSIILALIAWKSYVYFIDKEAPKISISGIKEGSYYSSNIQCSISSNKTGLLSIILDEKPIAKNFKIGYFKHEYPFTIPTETMSNGAHKMEINFSDGSYNKNKYSETINFYIDNIPLQAAFVKTETELKVFQGRTLHVQFQVNKKIKNATASALSNNYECYPESKDSSIYETFIPILCEENPNEYLLTIDIVDHVGNTLKLETKFQIIQFPFKKEILVVKPEKVKAEKELGKSHEQFEKDLAAILTTSPKEKLWRGKFCAPIEIAKMTCDFGTIRISQEKGKYTHRAVDLTNQPKSVVWAAQSGIVKIKDRYAMTGNTVVIDHGWGIITMYFHMDSLANINIGDKINQGNPVGTLGETGYASGYHLHWELRVNNMPVDPMQWINNTF